MNALTRPVSVRSRAGFITLRLLAALFVCLVAFANVALGADDPYYRWAVAKFGQNVASDPAQQSSVWGENADPDRDGIVKLLEFDPASRIRSYGVEGSGPQRWAVETKAGLTLDFGLAVHSRIKPEGSAAALVWAVEKSPTPQRGASVPAIKCTSVL